MKSLEGLRGWVCVRPVQRVELGQSEGEGGVQARDAKESGQDPEGPHKPPEAFSQ